jgi:biopolymer transport protein ExbD
MATPKFMDDDARQDYLDKKAHKKYKAQVRKYKREAENDNGELNLTAMMDMMTILLVFLLKSYGAVDISIAMGPDLTPPNSRSTLQPMKTVTVTVTKKDIAVGDKGVMQLDGMGKLKPEDAAQGLLLSKVKDALDAEVDKENKIVANNKAEAAKLGTDKDPTRTLTIVGDKDMPYETLFSVLGTAGQSGLKYFKFLVIQGS